MKLNKNILFVFGVSVIIAVAYLYALNKPLPKPNSGSLLESEMFELISEGPINAEPTNAYLLLTVEGQTFQPLPLNRDMVFSIHQKENNLVNVVEITHDSIKMRSANCPNQDCIHQGIVTLDNHAKRVLGNQIVCLPNKVALVIGEL